jgi:hypothetical protein
MVFIQVPLHTTLVLIPLRNHPTNRPRTHARHRASV